MANILDRYGIKEVQDVTFYEINKNGKPAYPVLYLDTLKVSTIESTAETADATGGKGNAKLITWDYGKEITVTIEDALFSAKSLAIMFGDGTTKDIPQANITSGGLSTTDKLIARTEVINVEGTTVTVASIADQTGEVTGCDYKVYKYVGGTGYKKINPRIYRSEVKENESAEVTSGTLTAGKYFVTYDLKVKEGSVINVGQDSFPSTYYVTGDTYARNATTGKDEFFQFIIPKAKVTSENTITLEAEGDPSVFNMNLTVLRPDDGVMMKLVKYELDGTDASEATESATIYHNHDFKEEEEN